ncbi:3-hydroxyacyl-CoA dehydrogenase NAD-binding domain-containing protein [Pseudomonas sp. PDM31]|uniref:3-hydroxyacyl-CoA dehydrogenase NAD-binding domain-containing protein n=1 Tax=Pseudomonas sp. PDM31 TaxID=2854778 RepID=UPI001C444C15|nr:3-hydroxyacyl-CoA dehydrogenase NAD-binding domain-containing protein [Pseudomonas sp. PDM31]MBV7477560.1 enoyl-CoA hydratase/isomerase family protein [Pseudomonas sp. PDM31]
MFETIDFALGKDGVAVVTIDIPGQPANTITERFRDELAEVVERVAADAEIRGVVITSAKKDFVAGGDLKEIVRTLSRELSVADARDMATQMSPLLRRLESSGKPYVAAINGSALGGGLEIALACHHRLVLDNPRILLGLPEATLGLMPGAGGTQRLPRLIGIASALPLMMKGTLLSPDAALAKGIVDGVLSAEQLLPAARAWILEHADAQQPWDKKGYQVPGGAGFADAELGNLFNLTTTQIARDTARNLPAPIALLRAVAHGTCVPIDAGLHIESCEFAKLVLDPTACNMVRTLFVNKGELEKLTRRPKAIEPASITRVGVVGAGLMGSGIAQTAAVAGLQVVLLDASAEQATAGRQRLADEFAKRVAKGRMVQASADEILARIQATGDYSELAECDLVVEAVFEDVQVKAAVFMQAQAVMKPGAILASNTSTLPITDMARDLNRPDGFIGLHFFSPVDRMPLVEVVVGQQTSDTTLAHALDFIRLLRKTPIVVKDSRGFFTSRVIAAYLQESLAMLGSGVKPALIDNAARLAGFAMGPLALLDDIGMENGYKSSLAERAALGDAWSEPAGFKVQEMFSATLGRIGRRCGKGFYDYPEGKRTLWSGLADVYPPLLVQPDVEDIKKRMLYIQALEAARCMEEGVIGSAAEGDVGSLLGIGFPTWTGGVFSLIDTVGAIAFVNACDRLADLHGERFRPSAWMRQRAESGERFHAREQ